MSLGTPNACYTNPAYQTTINKLNGMGKIIVVSAGNDNLDTANYSPASCDGVITVAATGPTGNKASYSNRGNLVEISAPGGDQNYIEFVDLKPEQKRDPARGFLSTLNDGAHEVGCETYVNYDGTSMAAPLVAGVVALMKQANPGLNWKTATEALQKTAKPLNDGSNFGMGAGLVKARPAIEYAAKLAGTPITTPPTSKPVTTSPRTSEPTTTAKPAPGDPVTKTVTATETAVTTQKATVTSTATKTVTQTSTRVYEPWPVTVTSTSTVTAPGRTIELTAPVKTVTLPPKTVVLSPTTTVVDGTTSTKTVTSTRTNTETVTTTIKEPEGSTTVTKPRETITTTLAPVTITENPGTVTKVVTTTVEPAPVTETASRETNIHTTTAAPATTTATKHTTVTSTARTTETVVETSVVNQDGKPVPATTVTQTTTVHPSTTETPAPQPAPVGSSKGFFNSKLLWILSGVFGLSALLAPLQDFTRRLSS